MVFFQTPKHSTYVLKRGEGRTAIPGGMDVSHSHCLRLVCPNWWGALWKSFPAGKREHTGTACRRCVVLGAKVFVPLADLHDNWSSCSPVYPLHLYIYCASIMLFILPYMPETSCLLKDAWCSLPACCTLLASMLCMFTCLHVHHWS